MRYYAIRWTGGGRSAAINLDDTPAGRRAEVVRSLAEGASAAQQRDNRARTELVAAPDPGAHLGRVTDYLWSDGTFNAGRLGRHLAGLRAGVSPHAFTLRTGIPADGADLVGRESALNTATQRLSEGRSLHLMAPRRYGKTSFLRRLARDLRTAGRTVVTVEADNLDSIGVFAVALVAEAIRDGADLAAEVPELRGWPSRDASPVTRMAARDDLLHAIRDAPAPFLGAVLSALGRQRVIVLVDEFSRFLLNGVARDRSGLHRGLLAARRARQRAGLTMVVAGSAGLRTFIASQNMNDAFDDLVPEGLEPLAPEIARTLVEELFYGHSRPPTPAVVDAVVDHIGAAVPYFLQALVHHTLAEGSPLDVSAVDRAYRLRLLDSEGNQFFKAFRLSERGYRDEWRAPAARILARLARSNEPVPLDELRGLCPTEFDALLAALAEDYDVMTDGGARLRSKVLRERWALRESWLTGG